MLVIKLGTHQENLLVAMSRPTPHTRKREADDGEIQEQEAEPKLSQEELGEGMARMTLRSKSKSPSVSRQNSGSSVVESDGNVECRIDAIGATDANIATIMCVFEDKDKERFVATNTQFSFNPQELVQRNEVKTKLAKIKEEAMKWKATYEVILLSGVSRSRTITKVGGASQNYTTKRFPPSSVATSWLKNAEKKARKPRTKKARTATFGLYRH